MSEPNTITVEELKEKMDRGEDILVLDVREPFEYKHANVGGLLIPLGLLPSRLNELDKGREILVLCHHGNRSGRATQFLLQSGFKNVRNILGGIEAWSRRIDPSVPRY
jgi:adenylyltransferase/sulfurtransferase